jgi:AraC family transcriptional regulator of adaptative response / DNA-3-methyladenine glycosylase II
MQGTAVRLGYRPPYDVDAMPGFFRKRFPDQRHRVAWPMQKRRPRWARTLRMDAGPPHTGWLMGEFDTERSLATLRVSDSLREVLPLVIRRLRARWTWTPIRGHQGGAAWAFPRRRRPARARRTGRLRARHARRAGPADHGGRGAHAHAAPGGPLWRTHRHAAPRLTACSPHPPCWQQADGDALGSWASCANGARRSIVGWRAPWPTVPCTLHPGVDVPATLTAVAGAARHRRLDGAVHRHACTALARRLSRGDVALHQRTGRAR